MNFLASAMERVGLAEPLGVAGIVTSLRGLTLLVDDLPVPVGTIVHVVSGRERRPAEVVGFEGRRAIVMMLGQTGGVRSGDQVISVESSPTIQVGDSMLGRVIDALGAPIDGGPALRELTPVPLSPRPIGPMLRRKITRVLPTGVRAIDLMTTVGRGQRVGIFAGPGVGKSVLLGMVAKRTSADVNVIAMIGERGREVREFIEHTLGPEGLARSVVIVSTSDESPLMRVRGAMAACSVAEYFRDQGKDVMLVMDSVTRFAHAQRQIGLAVGEPPATKGYTPSVFSMLPLLLERAGSTESHRGALAGSITGFYTILVEGDDMTEPVADAVRGILDGHVVLSRSLAHKGHYPAIDVLDSVSRLFQHVTTPEHAAARMRIVQLAAAYRDAEELIQIGAYAPGSNPVTDMAIRLKPRIDAILRQSVDEAEEFESARDKLMALAREADAPPGTKHSSAVVARPAAASPSKPAPVKPAAARTGAVPAKPAQSVKT